MKKLSMIREIICIDELDKLCKFEAQKLLEAMES